MGMRVVASGDPVKIRPRGQEQALKRLAIQIAAQLPNEVEDALEVLEHAKTLVRSFLGEPGAV